MAVRTLDYSALTGPVTRADIGAWRAQARAAGLPWASGTFSVGSVVGVGFAAVIFVFVFGGVLTSFFTEGIRSGDPFGVLFPSMFIVVIAVVTIGAVRRRVTGGGCGGQWCRVGKFARAKRSSVQPE